MFWPSRSSIFILVLSLVLLGCQNRMVRPGGPGTSKPDSRQDSKQDPGVGGHSNTGAPISGGDNGQSQTENPNGLNLPPNTETPEDGPQSHPPAAEPTARKNLKIALILGPGALRSFAHVGVLQELMRAKLPIAGFGGLEWGSLPAALAARKGQPFDPEWQMMKLREDDFYDRGLLGDKSKKSKLKIEEILQRLFTTERAEQALYSFGCASYNLEKRSAFLMERGPYKQLLPYCLALPPMMPPHNGSIGDATQLVGLSQHFRQKGFNFIIFVNLIESMDGFSKDPLTNESIQWTLIQQTLRQQAPSTDFIIDVPLRSSALDFEQRKAIIEIGKSAAKSRIPALLKTISDFEKNRSMGTSTEN